MFESTASIACEFQKLETALGDPAVHADLARARGWVGATRAAARHEALDEYARLTDDLEAAKEWRRRIPRGHRGAELEHICPS